MNTVAFDNNSSGWRSWLRRLRPHRISATERAVITAHGKALTLLTTALQAKGHLDAQRFGEMLGLYGTVVSEDDKLQGAILATWAAAVEEGADAIRTDEPRP